MGKRALWLCVWLMGVMWVFGEGHAEKPEVRAQGKEGASGKQSAALVLLLKQLNEKLERLTQKMSRIEGRLVVLEANQHKQKERLEQQQAAYLVALERQHRVRTAQMSEMLVRMVAQLGRLRALVEEVKAKGRKLSDDLKMLGQVMKVVQANTGMFPAGAERVIEGLSSGRMRWIPAGEFVMGSPTAEANRSSNEGPQRTVRISKGFWMMESEVTQGQWKEVTGSAPEKLGHKSCGEKCPVEGVSWHQVAAYANKLSEKAGLEKCFVCRGEGGGVQCEGVGNKGSDYVRCKGWRLPTEAEWEYAARAGTKTAYHTGDCISAAQANYDGNYPQTNCEKGENRNRTIEACSLARNAWELCDMHGNVWEWVYDGYEETAYQKLGAVDPVYVAATSYRVKRGGSWYSDARNLRAANRYGDAPTGAGIYLGFRLLRR